MPSRLILRLSVDYLVKWSRFVSSYNEGDLLRGLVQSSVFQASAELPGPEGSGGEPESGDRRAISIYALALSLGQPRETVRRKVKLLVAKGYLVETPDGVRIPDGHLETERSRQGVAELAGFTRQFLANLSQVGVAVSRAPVDGGREAARARLAFATNGYCLRLIEELNRVSDGDVMRPLVFSALNVANTRHLPLDLSSPYVRFDPPMPEDQRRPVTALALSEMLGVPRETTRRYLSKVMSIGGARRVKGGYIAVEAAFSTPGARRATSQIVDNSRRFAADLPLGVLDILDA